MAKRFDYTYTVWWNCLLITLGGSLFALGAKSVAVPHGFIAGGVFGVGMLLNYVSGLLTPGVWYFLLNVPLFVLGRYYVSKRFFWYSLYAMVLTTLVYESISYDMGIQTQLYAAIAAGVICGAGAGLVLRSLGSNGGLDVLAVILFQRYNIGIGRFYFLFNLGLFSVGLVFLDIDLVIASLIFVFITSVVVDQMLSLFSQRKSVFIVSEKNREIAREILDKLKQGATFIKGYGAFSEKERDILMTVVNNVQLKRLEEIVFSIDDSALFIVENTFSVLGASFSKRKLY
ncbi:Protein of unknown function DUF2179 [Alkalidesulfovibrio alkalitolerans DSM 16529]|uniref:DUF2179 domain-containing protein n=1 Tax=Alkalidesulfovibrio alkalitolerans DSM 16529 TaxID=1121439 RepID=S7U9L0_9BACT|nr:YitT family protein [Alkalidesulfovibrio alkalitolerans]EPR30629.1 Protein of unknown function DUF2179 [Alkalidesulfovibrio alkalitolerans DSM 16529]